MAKEPVPSFDQSSANWAHTVLFQALIVQLIGTQVLSVEDAQRVFDLALERTKKERERAPDAELVIQHIHDNLKWDDYYRWAAEQRAKKS